MSRAIIIERYGSFGGIFSDILMNVVITANVAYKIYLTPNYRRENITMVPISIKEFVDITVKNNAHIKKEELVSALRDAVARKKAGAGCICCGNTIWAAGSAVVGSDMCFTCITGEADDSEDYEVESTR